LLVAIIATIWLGTLWWIRGYEVGRDVGAIQHRAQVAANADDMLGYMQQLKTNLDHYGMTQGHTVLFLGTPENDLALYYESVNQIISRLEQVKDLPQNETAYQVALDDLRGTIRELEDPSGGFVFVQMAPIFGLVLVIWIVFAVVKPSNWLD